MATIKVYVPLSEAARQQLCTEAQREYRRPAEHAAYLLERLLVQSNAGASQPRETSNASAT